MTHEELLQQLDEQGIDALFDACGEYHKARSRPGGTAMCVCGMGGGGAAACRGLKLLHELFRNADLGDERWKAEFGRIQRMMDR